MVAPPGRQVGHTVCVPPLTRPTTTGKSAILWAIVFTPRCASPLSERRVDEPTDSTSTTPRARGTTLWGKRVTTSEAPASSDATSDTQAGGAGRESQNLFDSGLGKNRRSQGSMNRSRMMGMF